MKVLKFGSSTLASPEKMRIVADIVAKEQDCIIVLSSIKGTAESLSEISNYLYKKNYEGANEVINRLELEYLNLASVLFANDKIKAEAIKYITSIISYIRTFTKDLFTLFEERVIMAQGELISSQLFFLLMHEKNHPIKLIPALDFMRTDKNSTPDPIYIKDKLTSLIKNEEGVHSFLTQGYICKNAYGEIDDLRKGGSDYSASLIGAALSAEQIQIWADVDVMQNNDSKYVENTSVVSHLSFDEAAELAYFGAKILHPTSISPARMANISILLKNIYKVSAEGTLISNTTKAGTIKAVAAKDGITAIKIKSGRMLLAHGFLRRVFEVFENYQTSIDMLTSSEVGISVTIDNNKHLVDIIDDLKKYGTVTIDDEMVIIGVVGDLNWQNIGFESQIMDAIKSIPIRMISYGGSNCNFSFLIKKEHKEKALQLLNSKLFQTT